MPVDRDAALTRAGKFLRQGRLDAAIDEYAQIVADFPRDSASINTLGDLYVRNGQIARAVDRFTAAADSLFDEGFLPKAQAIYKKALRLDNTHDHTLMRLADIATRQELLVDARSYLRRLADQRRGRGDERGAAECIVRLGLLDDADMPAKLAAVEAAVWLGESDRANQLLTDHDVVLAVAERGLLEGKEQQAASLITRLVAQSPDCGDALIDLAGRVADAGFPSRAFGAVDVLVDSILLSGDLPGAAELLHAFASRVQWVPALAKLAQIHDELGNDAARRQVEALIDDMTGEYRDHGDAAVTAGLVAAERSPADRAIAGTAVATDGPVVAPPEMEAGDASVLSDSAVPSETADEDAASAIVETEEQPAGAAVAAEPDVAAAPREPMPEPAVQVVVSAIEETAAVGEAPRQRTESEPVEVDLSEVLSSLEASPSLPVRLSVQGPDLDAVFGQMRADADEDAQRVGARAHFAAAGEQLRQGDDDAAIAPLQMAARVPEWRFKAGTQLARVLLQRGDLREAIEWFERAAEGPAPTRDEGRALLYDLASTLEAVGESARALAVLLELDVDAPGYRDVAERIRRLSRDQAGSRLA